MVLKWFKKLNSSRSGFSMVEVTVAMGVASVLSLALIEMMKTNSVTNQNVAASMIWNGIINEINMLLNTPTTCQNIFTSKYPTGGSAPTPYNPSIGTTASSFSSGTALVIPRLHTPNSFQNDYTERTAAGGGGVKILKIETLNPTNPSTDKVKLDIHIQAQRASAIASTQVHYEKTISVTITRSLLSTDCPGANCVFNSIISCSSSISNASSKDACDSIGGVWTDTPTPPEPHCKYLGSRQTPPTYTPYLTNTSAYYNLCPAGQAISGIDLSGGKAVAACTNSNPLSNAIPNCIGGVLTWQADGAMPSQGKYVCHALPGSAPGSTVPISAPTIAGCAAGKHLYWNGTNFSCTNDDLPPAAPTCPPEPGQPVSWKVPIWDGTAWVCQAMIPNPNTDGTGDCQGTKFLQWDSASASYRCNYASTIPACQSDQMLTWTGNDFQCVYLKDTSAGKDLASDCPLPNRTLYDAGSHRFYCMGPPSVPPFPPTCNGIGQVLQWNGSNFSCYDIHPIDYTQCITKPAGPGALMHCDWPTVAVGFCSSGGGTDCSPIGASRFYMDPDWWVSGVLHCCRVNSTANTSRWYEWTWSYPTGINGSNTPDYNDKSNYGNLAKCENDSVVLYGLCVSDSGKDCSGASVHAVCGRTFGWSLNNHTTRYLSLNSNGDVTGYSMAAMTESGCHFVNGEEWGEWAHCAAGEVMVGACGSGTDHDCSWSNKGENYASQALCCPVK